MSERVKPIIVEAPQRSEEWYKARLGLATASKASDVLGYYAVTKKQIETALLTVDEWNADGKTSAETIERLAAEYPFELIIRSGVELKELAARTSYRQGLVSERISGMPADPDQYITYDMKWGTLNEEGAKALYAVQNGMVVNEAPFMIHPKLKCGASPDGLPIDMSTGEIGNCEAKCLRTQNHLYKIMYDEVVPDDYVPQMQMQMWINGSANWCDFIGFDSRVPKGLRIFVKRVPRDDFYIDEVLEPGMVRFLAECDRDERHFRAKIREERESGRRLQS